jgi:hypothetical protein
MRDAIDISPKIAATRSKLNRPTSPQFSSPTMTSKNAIEVMGCMRNMAAPMLGDHVQVVHAGHFPPAICPLGWAEFVIDTGVPSGLFCGAINSDADSARTAQLGVWFCQMWQKPRQRLQILTVVIHHAP